MTWNTVLMTIKFVNVANFLAVKTKRDHWTILVCNFFIRKVINHNEVSMELKCVLLPFEVEVSPLENAIQVVENKNQELRTLISQYQHKQMHGNINLLSMCLNGVIDAAVNGGIARYQEVSRALLLNIASTFFNFIPIVVSKKVSFNKIFSCTFSKYKVKTPCLVILHQHLHSHLSTRGSKCRIGIQRRYGWQWGFLGLNLGLPGSPDLTGTGIYQNLFILLHCLHYKSFLQQRQWNSW